MKTNEMIYDGKTKQVFATDYPNLVVIAFKDDVYDSNGIGRVNVDGIGAASNQISNILMPILEENGGANSFCERSF